ncbi:unnamed protein product [Nezara viridula]|uniref:Sulfotransferase domain-containing protein n=1 Tax=Nezara viridula TaxID=85310 RepID=A0A9P0MVI0_NEZVI|nr:unnamed protein product [Nezara viridula]
MMEPVGEKDDQRLMALFRGERSGFLRAQGCLLPAAFRQFDLRSLALRPSDVWIVTFPRSGTTWSQELIWLVNNGLDYDKALQKSLHERFPFIDVDFLCHKDLTKEVEDMNKDNPEAWPILESWREPITSLIDKMESPRHIKTHLPFELLPHDLLDKCKVVYVARNPLDVCVSYYHHNRLARLHDYTGDFPTYWKLFKNDEVVYAPYWAHVESGYSRRNHSNLLFLFYEDLKRDLPSQIRKVALFLNKTINNDDVEKLSDFLHIDNFKKNSRQIPIKGIANENRGSFIRKGTLYGEIGGNKEFTEDLALEAMEWYKKNIARNKMIFPEF